MFRVSVPFRLTSLRLAVLTALVLGAVTARAQMVTRGQVAVGWCAIQARVKIKVTGLDIQKSRGEGYGRVVCTYADGNEEVLPIHLQTKGMGVGVRHDNPSTTSVVDFLTPSFGVTGGGAQGLIGTYLLNKHEARVTTVASDGEPAVSAKAVRRGFAMPMFIRAYNSRKLAQVIGFGSQYGYIQISVDGTNEQAGHMRELPLRRPTFHSAAL